MEKYTAPGNPHQVNIHMYEKKVYYCFVLFSVNIFCCSITYTQDSA